MGVNLFYLYRVTGQLLPICPVYVLLFQRNGLSVAEISLLLSIWCIPGFLLDAPSSVLADRRSRRNLLVEGRVLKAGCLVVWALWGSFLGYASGFILWGAGSALASGAEEAWLYDCLKVQGRED